jgi:hypothetical protein
MAVSQRPLTLGEILDRTVQLYRRNFLQFAGISALPAALMVVIFGVAGLLISSLITSLKPDGEGALAFGLVIAALILLGVPLLIAAFALAMSASNYAVFLANQGQKPTIRASYAYGFRHFWRHLWLLFLQGLLAWVVPYLVFVGAVVVGAVLATLAANSAGAEFFIPALIVLGVVLAIALMVVCILIWLRFSLAFPVSVAEEAPAWPSMQRSGRLSKGTRGRIFVMFLLVYALSVAVSLALMIPMFIAIALVMRKSLVGSQPAPAFIVAIETVNFGISFLVRAFVMPVYATALMLFYYDQRTRQEGYDIEQLMAQAGWGQMVAAPPVSPVYAPPEGYADPAGGWQSPAAAQPAGAPLAEPPAAASLEPLQDEFRPFEQGPVEKKPNPERQPHSPEPHSTQESGE